MRHHMSYETFWAIVILALLALLPSIIRYAARQFALAQIAVGASNEGAG